MSSSKKAGANPGDHEITLVTIKELGGTVPATCVRPIITAASKIVETTQNAKRNKESCLELQTRLNNLLTAVLTPLRNETDADLAPEQRRDLERLATTLNEIGAIVETLEKDIQSSLRGLVRYRQSAEKLRVCQERLDQETQNFQVDVGIQSLLARSQQTTATAAAGPHTPSFEGFPTELIITIINLATPETYGSHGGHKCVGRRRRPFFPYTALWVCTKWRDIVMSFPIWDTVHACNRDLLGPLSKRMDLHRKYSGGRLLSLKLYMESHPDVKPHEFMNPFMRLMKPVSRWRSIEMLSGGYPPISFPYFVKGLLTSKTYPNLEELEVWGPDLDDPDTPSRSYDDGSLVTLVTIASKCPRLRKATFSDYHLTIGNRSIQRTWRHPLMIISLRNLRELSLLGVEWSCAVRFFPGAELPLLDIVTVRIAGGCPDDESQLHWKGEDAKLPSLRTAILYNFNPAAISSVVCWAPNLKHLAFAFDKIWNTLDIGLLQPDLCPDLVTLGIKYHQRQGDWSGEIERRWPRLQRLVVDESVHGFDALENRLILERRRNLDGFGFRTFDDFEEIE